MNRQLSLDLSGRADAGPSPLPTRVEFAMPTRGGAPFDDDGHFFEPWWPGAQAHLRVQDGVMQLRTEHLIDPLLAFPELQTALDHIHANGIIIAGTLLALDGDGRPDARLLRHRLADTPDGPAEGAFVASDLLYCDGKPLSREPFVERRRRLAGLMTDSDHCVVGRGLARDGTTLARAVASLGLEAISARRLDGRWRPGPSGDRWLKLGVTEPPTRPTRPFLVLLKKLPLDD